MTEYTRENPLTDGPFKVYREEVPGIATEVIVDIDHGFAGETIHIPSDALPVLAEFHEAERTGWHWTSDDHTEARNGRWVVYTRGIFAFVKHDDFPGSVYGDDQAHVGGAVFVREAHRKRAQFREWEAAQNQPAEPTGFGYVGTVTEECGREWDINRVMNGLFRITSRKDGSGSGGHSWPELLKMGTFKAVERS